MRVMVTGGTGFLGGAICKELLRQNHTVYTVSRKPAASLESTGINVCYGDLSDINFTEKSLNSGIDSVIHCAGKPGIWGNYEDYYNSNVKATENIIAACLKNNIKSLIYTSSPSVVFDLKDQNGIDETEHYPKKYYAHYPKTKAMAEQIVMKANSDKLATVALRPHLIWGPGDRHIVPGIIKRAKMGKMLLINSGKNIIDTTYIDNAVYSHILALEKLNIGSKIAGNIYFITNDEPMESGKIINSMLKQAGIAEIKKSVPEWTAYTFGAFLEFTYKITNRKEEPFLTKFSAKELACSHWFNITKAKNDLGYKPQVSIEEGLQSLKQWLKENDIL